MVFVANKIFYHKITIKTDSTTIENIILIYNLDTVVVAVTCKFYKDELPLPYGNVNVATTVDVIA